MYFGIAKDIITPYQPSPLSGYSSYYDKLLQGIHDDLFVKTLLLDDGKQQVLLLSLDLLFHDYELSRAIKAYACEKHGISPHAVVLSYTHTHGGPSVYGYEDETQFSLEYEDFLKKRIQTCIDRAMMNRFAGTIAYGSIHGDWNINRRAWVNGKMENRPNPEGPKDDQVDLLRICDQSGDIKVLFVNYACHPVTVRDELFISSDFPGRICQLLEAEHFGAAAIFFQGAGGNTRPRNTVKGRIFIKRTYAEVDETARAIKNQIQRALVKEGSFTPIELDLAAHEFTVDLPLNPFPRELFSSVMMNMEAGSPGYRNIARQLFERYEETTEILSVPAALIRLQPNLLLTCLGGEPCYEVKRNLQTAFPDQQLIFIGYLDSSAYIPDDQIISEGGYEADGSAIEYGLKGSIKPGIDLLMREAFSNAFRQMERHQDGLG